MVHNKKKVPVHLYFYETMIMFNMVCICLGVHTEPIDIHNSTEHLLCIDNLPMI